jgi:hypothetical protein
VTSSGPGHDGWLISWSWTPGPHRLDSFAIPIKRSCRCVSVPAPGWELSTRVYRRQRRRRLPAPAGFTKSSMTASVFWRGVVLPVWITRSGNDFSSRFPFIAMAVGKLPVWSCLIDGEAIVCDENGLAVFDLIRRHGALASAVHCAFDLLELDGLDLRREPIEMRKELLAERLRGSNLSIVP